MANGARSRWGSEKGLDWIVRFAVGLGASSWLTRAGVSDALASALGGVAIAALPELVAGRYWPRAHALLDRHGVTATLLLTAAILSCVWCGTSSDVAEWPQATKLAMRLWTELSKSPDRTLGFYVIALGFLQGWHLRRLTSMVGSTSKFRAAIDSVSPRLELTLALSLAFAPAPYAAEARGYYTAVCFGLIAHSLLRWGYEVAADRAQLRGVIRDGVDPMLPELVKRALRLAERGPLWIAALFLGRHAPHLCTRAKLVRAWLLHQLRRTADAIAVLEGELRNDDRDEQLDPQLHTLLHVMHNGRGDLAASLGCLRRAEQLDPNCHFAATRSAVMRVESVLWNTAACSLTTLSNDAQIITQAYESARRQRHSAISRMVGHAGDVTPAFFADARACAAMALREYRSAEALFREAFEADPRLASAHMHYAELLLLTTKKAGRSRKQSLRDARTHLYVAIQLSGPNTATGRRAADILRDARERAQGEPPAPSNPGSEPTPPAVESQQAA